MDAADRASLSAQIQEKVLRLPAFRGARCVAAYAALPFEVATDLILSETLKRGKTLALPRTDWSAHRMDMIRVGDIETDLVDGEKGIREPGGDARIDPERIDLVVVPGRAFDRSLNRVGQGGGFYDAFMKDLRRECVTCAVAFEIQVFDRVPADERDLRVGMIVTEVEIYRATSPP
jgi:5-formyltetrahydrofolate cyclo-ligase